MAFNALTINDGLSQGMVTCIFQDSYGFMWFATLDGLNRYDGYHFVVYRHDAQNERSISEGFVQTLFEDSKGRLWIGTISGGLDIFDRKTETFTHVRRQNSNLSDGHISTIAEDKQGHIWVQIFNKLDEITVDEKADSLRFLIHHIKVPFHSAQSFLHISIKGSVYYLDAENGLMYQLNNGKIENWSVVFGVSTCCQQQPGKAKSSGRILHMLEDTAQEKYYVFHEGGISCFDETSARLERTFSNALFNSPYLSGMSLDKNGIIWLIGNNGLSRFDTNTGALSVATTKDSGNVRSLNHAYCTFVERSGLLWIGTSGYGILKRNLLSEAFHHTGNSYTYSIKEAADGTIMLGNNVSTHQLFDKTKGKIIGEASQKNKDQYSLSKNTPFNSDANGDWFLTADRLNYYDKQERKIDSFLFPIASNEGYSDFVLSRLQDSSRNIWLGSADGLLRFNLASRRWTIYKTTLNNPTSLSSNLIFSLCLDPLQPKKYIWVGTGGSGLNRMDIATGSCITYTMTSGLPNNVIYGLLPDEEGNLWMSTNKGITCFNPVKQSFRNFDYKDGLQSNEFNRGACLRTKDGYLFFGGINGFNYFYPRNVFDNTTIPQIQITGLLLHNEPIPVLSQSSPLKEAIYLTKTLTLPYEENVLSFDFSSMDFTNSEQNQYQYKLQGFNKDWIRSGTNHNATYTNLDPGTYTFLVRGSNNDGVWNEQGTSIQLVILPPWYMTWWFRCALVMAVVLIGYGLYRYRLAQVLKLQSIRDRIANDLHDEVGSNLSNIYIFSNIAQQKATANDGFSPLLQKITEYSQDSMEAMNDIVWMINTRNDRFENMMVRMRTIAAEFSETSACSLQLNLDEQLHNIKLNMEERKNFYLIYKEAINNTAKYAGCKDLWIDMKLQGNTVVLQIRDNGKGFDAANTRTGNGIFNMKKRAQTLKGNLTITSIPGGGTTLELRFKV